MWDIRLYNWLGLFNKTMSLKIKKKDGRPFWSKRPLKGKTAECSAWSWMMRQWKLDQTERVALSPAILRAGITDTDQAIGKGTRKRFFEDTLPLSSAIGTPFSGAAIAFMFAAALFSKIMGGRRLCSLKWRRCKRNSFLVPARGKPLGGWEAALMGNPNTERQVRAFWTQWSTVHVYFLCSFIPSGC